MRIIWCTPGRSDEAAWIADVTRRGFSVVRRCVEAADLLAAASIEPDAAIVVDVDTPRLGVDALAALPPSRARRIIALASDQRAAATAHGWGIDAVVEGCGGTAVEQIAAALYAAPSGQPSTLPTTNTPPTREGRVVVVYGPVGSPGRSTVALGLAESWARTGERVCLVDADTIAPNLALMIGMVEDVSGLLVAARYADQGSLDARSLGSSCRRLDERLWLMSGIGSPDRWIHARPSALDRVWHSCAQHFDRVVIDVNPLLDTVEADDPLAGALPARDSATRSALRASDAVVMVTKSDPLNVSRLLTDLPSVQGLLDHAHIEVVVNRVPRRNAAIRTRVGEVLAVAGSAFPIHAIPDDSSVATCVASGALLGETGATGRVRRSLVKVRDQLVARESLTVTRIQGDGRTMTRSPILAHS